MTKNRFSESILWKVFYPNGVKSVKYLLKNFVSEETGKTAKKFQSDPEEPLNKLPIKEIDNSEQILREFVIKIFFIIKIVACLSFFVWYVNVQSASSNWLHLAADIHSLSTFPLNLELRPLSRYADP